MQQTKFPRSNGELRVDIVLFFCPFQICVTPSKEPPHICHTLGSAVNMFLYELCMTVNIKQTTVKLIMASL